MAGSKYTIREIDATEHVDVLRMLHKKTFAGTAPFPKLNDYAKGGWWLVFFEEDVPAGFAAIHPSLRLTNAAYLYRCGVLDTHRGNHLQRRLLEVRERWARTNGYEYIRTDCTADNVSSANNLIRAGYRLFQPKSPWAFGHSLYWVKKLRRPRRARR